MPRDGWLHSYLRKVETAAIQEAIRRAEGNLSEASRVLGVSRTALYKRLRVLGIERPAAEPRRA
jgi:transcriptional regulator of acetoin/glycerol metabolism